MLKLTRRDILKLTGRGVGYSVLMQINPLYAQIGIPTGSWRGPNKPYVRLDLQYVEVVTTGANNLVRLDQQYVEVVTTGTNNLVQLDQQYVEVVTSGTGNIVRLAQQYLEVVTNYGPY